MFNQFPIHNRATDEFGYTNLSVTDTQDFIRSVAQLFDRVFETNDNLFEKYVISHAAECEDNPEEMFQKFFAALQDEQMTKYQRQFYNFSKANIESIFKWYHKNRERVNISPRQTEWFKRWFQKHGVSHTHLLNTPQQVKV